MVTRDSTLVPEAWLWDGGFLFFGALYFLWKGANELAIIEGLETERLILRIYRAEDAHEIFRVVSQKMIAATTIMIPHPYPRETVDWWIGFIRENMEKGEAYEFGLYRKSDGRYIGNCGLIGISETHRSAEFAYFIDPGRWGQGYATEACERLLRLGFEELGLERISARCMAKNMGSRRVLEKIGLKMEGLARHEVLKWEQFEDVVHYGLIRSEWNKENGRDF